MRAATLVYPKAAAGGMERSDEAETRAGLESLMGLAATEGGQACRPGVMRQMEGGAARQLLAAAALLGCTVPRALSGAVLTELVRDSGESGPELGVCCHNSTAESSIFYFQSYVCVASFPF